MEAEMAMGVWTVIKMRPNSCRHKLCEVVRQDIVGSERCVKVFFLVFLLPEIANIFLSKLMQINPLRHREASNLNPPSSGHELHPKL